MAQSISSMRKFQISDDELKCPLCLELVLKNDPKAISCLHTFCKKCLERFGRTNDLKSGKYFNCPSCRSRSMWPTKGVEGFKTNFYLKHLQEIQESPIKIQKSCASHGKPIIIVCMEDGCNFENICLKCLPSHENHRIRDVDDLDEVKSKVSTGVNKIRELISKWEMEVQKDIEEITQKWFDCIEESKIDMTNTCNEFFQKNYDKVDNFQKQFTDCSSVDNIRNISMSFQVKLEENLNKKKHVILSAEEIPQLRLKFIADKEKQGKIEREIDDSTISSVFQEYRTSDEDNYESCLWAMPK